jgi:hypothetical protein
MEMTKETELKLNGMKKMHDIYATVKMNYETRFQFFSEEFEFVREIIGYCAHQIGNLKTEIEKIEPPKPQEKPKAYNMDLGHVTSEKKPTLEVVQ